MEIDAVQDSFRLYFHRGRIPFSLIYKPLKFKCLNEMIVQILTDWVRACDAGAMWDEKINNPVTFIVPNGAGILPKQYEIPQIIVPVGNIRVITSFLREDKDIIKISLRSKGKVKVNEFSNKFYSGGGHQNAAGAAVKNQDINTVVKELIQNFKVFCSE